MVYTYLSIYSNSILAKDFMNKTIIGSVLTALGASLCCTGPLILIALGVTSVGVFSFIEPLRPYLTIFAMGILSYSFYSAFRKQPECCEADLQKQKTRKLTLFIIAPIIIGFLLFPNLIPAEDLSAITENQTDIISEWTVTGMTCQGCANGLQNAMNNMEGIIKCNVDYETRIMKCQTNPKLMTDEKLINLVTKVGYKAEKKESS